jgi:hypothetical protein
MDGWKERLNRLRPVTLGTVVKWVDHEELRVYSSDQVLEMRRVVDEMDKEK